MFFLDVLEAFTDPFLPTEVVSLEFGNATILTNHVVELYAKVCNGYPVQ